MNDPQTTATAGATSSAGNDDDDDFHPFVLLLRRLWTRLPEHRRRNEARESLQRQEQNTS